MSALLLLFWWPVLETRLPLLNVMPAGTPGAKWTRLSWKAYKTFSLFEDSFFFITQLLHSIHTLFSRDSHRVALNSFSGEQNLEVCCFAVTPSCSFFRLVYFLVWVLTCVSVCVHHVHASCGGCQKKNVDPLELELYLSCEFWGPNSVRYKNNKCS